MKEYIQSTSLLPPSSSLSWLQLLCTALFLLARTSQMVVFSAVSIDLYVFVSHKQLIPSTFSLFLSPQLSRLQHNNITSAIFLPPIVYSFLSLTMAIEDNDRRKRVDDSESIMWLISKRILKKIYNKAGIHSSLSQSLLQRLIVFAKHAYQATSDSSYALTFRGSHRALSARSCTAITSLDVRDAPNFHPVSSVCC